MTSGPDLRLGHPTSFKRISGPSHWEVRLVEASASRPETDEVSVRQARELIGVTASADTAQVARAYRRRARHLHPDLNVEPDATEQFWVLQAAYRVALGAARRNDDPASAQITMRNPTVVHVPPLLRGSVTLAARPGPGHRGVVWFAVGPVHVQPPGGTAPPGRNSDCWG
jgi:hypothetical protein